MGPIKPQKPQPSFTQLNRQRKEEKRKWKEQNLLKKLQKLEKSIPTEENIKSEQSFKEKENFQEPQQHNLTISIAVPGSILETVQSPELRAYVSGQIARAATIFKVDEIVIFDDYADEASAKKDTLQDNYSMKKIRESCVHFGRILQYMECPQYLRKNFFPFHHHLKYCGLLNPLNAPHHLSKDDDFIFREGVVLNKPIKSGKGSLVNVGLLKEVRVDKVLTPGIRCTVKLSSASSQPSNKKTIKGIIVSPSTPKLELGTYWGYTIRLAESISKIFSQCPYKEGYDLTIGTSDKGTSIDDVTMTTTTKYKHIIIIFGGVHGLEFAIDNDLNFSKVDNPELIFDYYLNTVPGQGSKTIRTEEAVFLTLATLRPIFNNNLLK